MGYLSRRRRQHPSVYCSTNTTMWLLLCAAILSAAAQRTPAADGPTYQFKYVVNDVNTNDYKMHEEIEKDGLVHGTYTVREPSGDLRVVSYTAGDERGFQAMVRVQQKAVLESEVEKPLKQTAIQTESDRSEPFKIQLNTEDLNVRRTQSTKKYDSQEILQRAATSHTSPKLEIRKEKYLQYTAHKKSPAKSRAIANKEFTQKSLTSC